MGFPSVCYTVLLPRPLALVFHLLDRIKLALSAALCYLGLSSPSYDDGEYLFVYPIHGLPDLPAYSSAAAAAAVDIKTRLLVVKFSALQAAAATCAVCLGALEAPHEVRVLGNCSHAFHKGCIDKWVDVGQTTCPLCRALLLPMETEMEEDAEVRDS